MACRSVTWDRACRHGQPIRTPRERCVVKTFATFGAAVIAALSFSSQVEISEWPTTLRTDLRGAAITAAFPENALDRQWNDALVAKFTELTGITVHIVRPGNDTTAVLAGYLRQLEAGAPAGDVLAIDIVWPGILERYAEDLRPAVGNLSDMLPELVQNDTVNGRLVAVPYFVEISVLFYRRDLLARYGMARPPATWHELEQQARMIQDGERARGRPVWGFLWQGAASEALTCNALEWQVSHGGGRLLDAAGAVSVDRQGFVRALERARGWVGALSPPDVTNHLEDDSVRLWTKGDAVFMRNWPYAYVESMKADSPVRNQVGVSVLPRSDEPNARHASILGGFQLMVSKASRHKSAAIELVKFLTSPEVQRVNARTRGYAPTRLHLYDDKGVLAANPFFGMLKQVLSTSAVTRPSTVAGARYDELSRTYFAAVREALTGEKDAGLVAKNLDRALRRFVTMPR
jgi:trehalose/maltose transport system substrate-binding protein